MLKNGVINIDNIKPSKNELSFELLEINPAMQQPIIYAVNTDI
jgi:hypothetical protein